MKVGDPFSDNDPWSEFKSKMPKTDPPKRKDAPVRKEAVPLVVQLKHAQANTHEFLQQLDGLSSNRDNATALIKGASEVAAMQARRGGMNGPAWFG